MRIFTLAITAMFFLLSPLLAMDPSLEEVVSSKTSPHQVLKCARYQVPCFETAVTCIRCHDLDFREDTHRSEIEFTIQDSRNTSIGQAGFAYYPDPKAYRQFLKDYTFTSPNYQHISSFFSGMPVLLLHDIKIFGDNFQRKGHGARAIETMITAFRNSPDFPEDAHLVIVRYWDHKEFESLRISQKFFERIGFKPLDICSSCENSKPEAICLTATLRGIEFPRPKKGTKSQGGGDKGL